MDGPARNGEMQAEKRKKKERTTANIRYFTAAAAAAIDGGALCKSFSCAKKENRQNCWRDEICLTY